MNLLTIGNSFSEDISRYLHRIARADGTVLETTNLYIGGCPLSTHYRNMMGDKKAYTLSINGESGPFYISIKEALLARDLDYVSLQQASLKSAYYESYQPYIGKLADYIREMCPKAKIIMHQTWAYEEESPLLKTAKLSSPEEMFEKLSESYKKAAADINADLIIPTGRLVDKMVKKGAKMHRDGFHLSLGLGRYSAGLLWYSLLTGNDAEKNSFCDFDEEVMPEDVLLAKECVKEVLAE